MGLAPERTVRLLRSVILRCLPHPCCPLELSRTDVADVRVKPLLILGHVFELAADLPQADGSGLGGVQWSCPA